jgi:O-antigen ligase
MRILVSWRTEGMTRVPEPFEGTLHKPIAPSNASPLVGTVTAPLAHHDLTDEETPRGGRWLLVALGICAPLLIYIPGVGGFPPLVTAFGLIVILVWARPNHPFPAAVLLALALMFLSLIALVYSLSVPLGLNSVLYFGELAGLILVGARLGPFSRQVRALVTAWTAAATIDALMVIYFRFNNAAELSWFGSSIARIFIASGTLQTLFTTGGNNALSPDKAGAFFVNADAGSAFLGVAFVTALYLWRSTDSKVWLAVALVDATAVVASGSTTGILLLFLISGGLLFGRIRSPAARLAAVPFGAVALAIGTYVIVSSLAGASDLSTRETLWSLAISAISTHPLTGLGFGGWDLFAASTFPLIGGAASYLPQNLLLYTWVQIGFAGLVCTVGFFLTIFSRLATSLFRYRGFVVAGVAWTLLHSMGDNTSIFNDFHTMPMLAVLVGSYLGTRR